MGLLSFFKKKEPQTANLAKERLRILVAHSRADAKHPKYLKQMRQEILDVVKKYVNVEIDNIDTNIANQDGTEVLELNITLPEGADIDPPKTNQPNSKNSNVNSKNNNTNKKGKSKNK